MIAKEIHDVIIEYEDDNEGCYFEPFCGMMSVGLEFAKDGRKVIACDSNPSIVAMWKELKAGWIPPKFISETKYNKIKNSHPKTREELAEYAYVGSSFSFGGTMFGMYRGRYQTLEKTKKEASSTL